MQLTRKSANQKNLKDFDVLNEVTDLIERKLDVMESLGEATRYRMNVRSRLVCRCPRCVDENTRTLLWLDDMRSPEPVAAEPLAPSSRVSRVYGER